jgi:hypothetical protein
LARGVDPDEEPVLSGEVPDIDASSFRDRVMEVLHAISNTGDRLLPKTHELATKIGKGKDEISLKELLGNTRETGVKVAKEVDEHKKGIALSALSVSGLFVVIKYVHSRRKK